MGPAVPPGHSRGGGSKGGGKRDREAEKKMATRLKKRAKLVKELDEDRAELEAVEVKIAKHQSDSR